MDYKEQHKDDSTKNLFKIIFDYTDGYAKEELDIVELLKERGDISKLIIENYSLLELLELNSSLVKMEMSHPSRQIIPGIEELRNTVKELFDWCLKHISVNENKVIKNESEYPKIDDIDLKIEIIIALKEQEIQIKKKLNDVLNYKIKQ